MKLTVKKESINEVIGAIHRLAEVEIGKDEDSSFQWNDISFYWDDLKGETLTFLNNGKYDATASHAGKAIRIAPSESESIAIQKLPAIVQIATVEDL